MDNASAMWAPSAATRLARSTIEERLFAIDIRTIQVAFDARRHPGLLRTTVIPLGFSVDELEKSRTLTELLVAVLRAQPRVLEAVSFPGDGGDQRPSVQCYWEPPRGHR
jgi:hypothetical protein